MVEGIRKWLAVVMVGLMSVPVGLAAGMDTGGSGEGAGSPRAGDYSSWTYYRDLSLDVPTSVAELQVPLELNNLTSFNYNHASISGDDLRFVNDDGEEQNYFIDDWNTSGISRIWINVSKSGTSNLRMYYGNPAASAKSNGPATYLFFDDFNDNSFTDNWFIDTINQLGTGTFKEDGGVLSINATQISGVKSLKSFSKPMIAEWRMKRVSGDGGIFYIESPSTDVVWYADGYQTQSKFCMASNGNNYLMHTQFLDDSNMNYNEFRGIHRDLTWTVSHGVSIYSPARTDTLTVTAETSNNNFYLRLSSYGLSYSTTTEWDWVRIRKFTDRIPVINVGGENGDYSGWKHSMDLQLDSPTLVDGLQVLLRLNTSNFDYSKADPMGDDIRFVDDSGYGQNYWVDVWNTSGESQVWIKVQKAGTSSLRILYGNPAAPAASNGDRTFEFFDDFNDGVFLDKWYVPDPGFKGTASENGGLITLTATSGYGTGYAWLESRRTFVGAFISEWRFQASTLGGASGTLFVDTHYPGPFGGYWNGTSYRVGVDWFMDGIGDFAGSPQSLLCGSPDTSWHEMRGSEYNTTWRVSRGNSLDNFERTDSIELGKNINDRTFRVNIESHEMGPAISKWDWLRVRKYAEKIPTIEIGTHAISLSVEKSEYLPGETVSARSRLTFESPSWIRPVPLKNISFEIDDPTRAPYFLMANTTDLTGNATISLKLPADAPEGLYTCYATANITGILLEANTTFTVRWPWSPAFSVLSQIIMTREYYPGDTIGLSAYAGYEYPPAAGKKAAPPLNLSMDVSDPVGASVIKSTIPTNVTGWADLSFTVPEITVKGIYAVKITGFEGIERTVQFNAAFRPGDIRLKTVTSPANVNRGAAFIIDIVINNSLRTNVNCLLVVQILDSNNVPLRPIIRSLNVTVNPGFAVNATVTIDLKSPLGTYKIQVQLLTGLPKDRGYALDFRDGTINVN